MKKKKNPTRKVMKSKTQGKKKDILHKSQYATCFICVQCNQEASGHQACNMISLLTCI